MEIKKVIADSKPNFCVECPLYLSTVKVEKSECGKYETVIDGAWKVGGKVPDERCLFEIAGRLADVEQQTYSLLEKSAEEIENVYGRETELSKQIRNLIG